MDPTGFEPVAPALQGRCSTRLSYRPGWLLILILKIKKEVIQPQVPLRLPCDDLAHLTEPRFAIAKKLRLI